MTAASKKALRLGPLPRQETTKLTLQISVALRDDLQRYAALHAQLYGEPVDIAALVPHMLEAFMSRDRGFRKQAPV